MKRGLVVFLQSLLIGPLVLAGILIVYSPIVGASSTSYNPAYLISDEIFTDTSSMSVTQIQNFLISENSGLYSYHDVEDCSSNPTYMARYYSCGKSVLAAQIIYDAAHAYSINPRSIMATMQKEEELITAPDPAQSQLDCAMGYTDGYPECDQSPVQGFFNQVDWGTWQFRTNIELMNGNSSWNGLSWSSSYSCGSATSLYSKGLYPGNVVTFANPHYPTDPYSTSKPVTVTLANSSTASLYCYTPYVGPYSDTYGYSGTGYSGSFNFVIFFEQAFGSVASACYNDTNVSSAPPGRKIMSFQYSASGPPNLAFTEQNDTGSACTEVHLWAPGYQTWAAHIATGMKATDPSQGTLVAGNFFGGNQDRLAYVKYAGEGSYTEIHLLSSNLKDFPGVYDVPTNLTNANPNTGTFVAGDFLRKGYDQLAYIKYEDAAGYAEVHLFSSDLRKATGTYDVVTNLYHINGSTGTFVAGDFLHRGYDQLAYIRYNSSGALEVHVFDKSLRKATGTYDVVTNLKNMTADRGTFVAANFNGQGDQLLYILYSGSSGRVEVHTFSPDLKIAVGYQDIITNMNAITLPL